MHPSFSRRNFIQNLVIGLLLCSALTLFVQTQIYNLGGTPATYLSRWVNVGTTIGTEQDALSAQLSTPVAVAVSTSFGRYGSPHLSTQDENFTLLGDLLSQGLSSLSTTATGTTQSVFLQAIDENSIYFDFQVSLPSNILAGMIGSANSYNQTQMRRLVLTPDAQGDVLLYWWDGIDTYAYTTTDIVSADFYALLEDYQADNVFFAFEGDSLSSAFNTLDPLSLFSSVTETYFQLSSDVPTWNEVTLLTQLGFNPYTNSRYTETNGTDVVFQGEDSVYLYPNGTVEYRADAQNAQLVLPLSYSQPTAYQLSSSTSQLLQSLLSGMTGDASLSISSFSQTDTQTHITFDYQTDGISIALSHGEPAASVVLEGTVVTYLKLYPRQYYTSDATSLLLPVTQAATTVTSGATMKLSYVDYATDDVNILWIYQ